MYMILKSTLSISASDRRPHTELSCTTNTDIIVQEMWLLVSRSANQNNIICLKSVCKQQIQAPPAIVILVAGR